MIDWNDKEDLKRIERLLFGFQYATDKTKSAARNSYQKGDEQ
jgi:hypothetical protein